MVFMLGSGAGLAGAERSLTERIRAIADAPSEDFGQLLKIADLDPATDLRFQDWSGSSFRNCDLRSFDFTGARLLGCDFNGARIEGARFDQAEIDRVGNEIAHKDAVWIAGREVDYRLKFARDLVDCNPLRAAQDWNAHVAEWRRPKRLAYDAHLSVGTVFQDAPFGPELVVVPPGQFVMGSPEDEPGRHYDEGPRHEVTISQAFAVGRYAVTFKEWDFAQADRYWRKSTGQRPRKPAEHDLPGRNRNDRPVVDVDWGDAQAYTRWLSAKTGHAYRLLSEAEWEYCCRAGSDTPFWWGSTITSSQANYCGSDIYEGGGEKGEDRRRTLLVDAFIPNPWGLHQMHGNVWEWVEDLWHWNYVDAPVNGSAWIVGNSDFHVLRGGSWAVAPRRVRSASRSGLHLHGEAFDHPVDVGFRLCRDLTL